MTIEMAVVLITVIVMVVCLIFEVARPDMVIFFALAFLILSGILTPAEALKGFSNEGMLTVGLLFIVAGAVQQSGLLDRVVKKLLGHRQSPKKAFLRMMAPVSGLSAFLNNTPIVVMLTPIIRDWCREHRISPSKFLLPLSYATIFGGMITLIGTSTNLVVHGLMLENGMDGLSMFQLAVVGIPGTLIGILYMSTIGYRLLPEKKPLEETFYKNSRDYLAEMVVASDCPLIGKSIQQAGLRSLTGLFLIEIVRETERITPVSAYEKLQAGDRLIFTGKVSTIVELQNIKGLNLETGSEIDLEQLKNGDAQLLEAVVSHHSSLLHKTIKEHNFRSKYDAAVVAVHRNNERIRGKIGDIVLRPGDILLMLAGRDFAKRWSDSNDFYLISSPIETPTISNAKQSKLAILTLLAMVLLVTLNILSMFKAALLAVAVLIFSKCISPQEAKRYVHFNVLLLIASSFGVGVALDKTGAADFIARYLVGLADGFGVIGILIMVYLLTNLFTEAITNSAAAVIMFPIAMAAANQTGVEPTAFIVTLAIAASASFATPIGYQTNLIVYGPGQYTFTDYMKVGIPLSLLFMVLTVSIVSFVWL